MAYHDFPFCLAFLKAQTFGGSWFCPRGVSTARAASGSAGVVSEPTPVVLLLCPGISWHCWSLGHQGYGEQNRPAQQGMGSRSGRTSTVVFPYLLPSVLKRKALHMGKTEKILLYCFNINSLIGKRVSNSPQCMVRPFFPALLTLCISSDLCGLMEVVFSCLALPSLALHSSALCFGLGLQASLRSFPPNF